MSLHTIISTWIENYKSNKSRSIIAILQYFIEISGAKGILSEDIEISDHENIVQIILEDFETGIGKYPLIRKGKAWKNIYVRFCEFIQTWIRSCGSILFDSFLMHNVLNILTRISDSSVKAYRHTWTLAGLWRLSMGLDESSRFKSLLRSFQAMKLITGLMSVEIEQDARIQYHSMLFHDNILMDRNTRTSYDHFESFTTEIRKFEENKLNIMSMLNHLFDNVVELRYCDTIPEVRELVLGELGVWIKMNPSTYLQENYIELVYNMLHDKSNKVRLKCIQLLKPLYKAQKIKKEWNYFVKLKERILYMSLDKDYAVSENAIKVFIIIYQKYNDIVCNEDCEHIFKLVFSRHRNIAMAAGDFLNLFSAELRRNDIRIMENAVSLRLQNTIRIKDLITFLTESALLTHSAYLVDALIESNPILTDWQTMTDLLLQNDNAAEELTDHETLYLIDIMYCCIRQAATGESPTGRIVDRRRVSLKNNNKRRSLFKRKITEHFIPTLPLLLDKYEGNFEYLAYFLALPRYFDLNVYITSKQKSQLSSFLSTLIEAIKNINDDKILESCGKTLNFVCIEMLAAFPHHKIGTAVSKICFNQYAITFNDWLSLVNTKCVPDNKTMVALTTSLEKIFIMVKYFDFNQINISHNIFHDLNLCKERTDFPNKAKIYLLKICFCNIIWSLIDAENNLYVENAIELLKNHSHAFVEQCKSIIKGKYATDMKNESFLTMCDLLIFFSEKLYSAHHKDDVKWKSLVYKPDAEMCELLNRFIQHSVFKEHIDSPDYENKNEIVNRKRYLAAYCKLIIYNILPIKQAADMLKHYVTHNYDFGDMIKFTIGKMLEINRVNCALVFLKCLQNLYTEMLTLCNGKSACEIKKLKDFNDLKMLAKYFGCSFGSYPLKNQKAMRALHRAGLYFSFIEDRSCELATPNLLFLEIITEFSKKLLNSDKIKIHSIILDEEISLLMDSNLVFLYKKSLVKNLFDNPSSL